MELLPHDKFSELRIAQFFAAQEVFEDDTGMEQTLLGRGRCLHCFTAQGGEIGFYYPDSPPRVLGAIDLSLQGSSSSETAQRILSACVPPLRFGMRSGDVLTLFGEPEHRSSRNEHGFFRFRVGRKWPYRVLCGFTGERGLWSVGIVREDFWLDDDD